MLNWFLGILGRRQALFSLMLKRDFGSWGERPISSACVAAFPESMRQWVSESPGQSVLEIPGEEPLVAYTR